MDTSHNEPMVAEAAKRGWRRHSPEFKSRVIELARLGSGSVAAVALANGLNANMLRKWVAESQAGDPPGARSQSKALATTAASSQAFVPLTLTAPPPAPPGADIRVEVRRGATAVSIAWPTAAADACAQWLRELLR